MTAEQMVKMAREQVDALTPATGAASRTHTDSRYDDSAPSARSRSREDRRALQGLEDSVPGCRRHGDSAVGSGDTAASGSDRKGTHTGPLETAEGTIPASGKQQETPAAFFFSFEGGKIKESRQYFDSMTLLKQIGAQPE